jgi:hypothetical protein
MCLFDASTRVSSKTKPRLVHTCQASHPLVAVASASPQGVRPSNTARNEMGLCLEASR